MAVQISGNDITVPRDTTVTRNLTVGGVLTYEDVTNVDSIGIVTARAGVLVGSGITLSKDGEGFFTGIVTATTFTGEIEGSTGTFTGDLGIVDKLNHIGDTNTALRFPAADTITAETGGTERLRITSGGQTLFTGVSGTTPLDIKTSNSNNNTVQPIIESYADNSTYKTQIGLVREGSSGALGWAFLTNAVGSPTERVRIHSSGQMQIGGTTLINSDPLLTLGQSASAVGSQFHLVNDGSADLKQIFIPAGKASRHLGVDVSTNNFFVGRDSVDSDLVIDSSGHLLLGTTTLGESGADDLTIENTSADMGITLRTGTTRNASLFFADGTSSSAQYSGYIQYAHNGDYMAIGTNGQETMRLHSDKRISVNTATKYGMIHSLEDQFNPDNEKWLTDAAFVASGSFGGGYALLDGSKGYSMFCADNGNDLYIRHHASTSSGASGGVVLDNAATSWTSGSDERDKENFVTISDAITKIKTLRTVTGNYTWQPDVRHAFLIAQDVQAVLPEAVSVMNKHAATEDQRLGLRYTEVIPLLVKAMQEQQEEIESLKARLDAAGL